MEFKHFSHHHGLVLHQPPQGPHEIHCSGCKTRASGDVYVCWQCNYFLHAQCFTAARSFKHPSHPQHPLTLVPSPTYPSGIFICHTCHTSGDAFSYSCSACEFDIHVHCAHSNAPNPLVPPPNPTPNANPIYPPPIQTTLYPTYPPPPHHTHDAQSYPPPPHQSHDAQNYPPPPHHTHDAQSYPPPPHQSHNAQNYPPPPHQSHDAQSYPPQITTYPPNPHNPYPNFPPTNTPPPPNEAQNYNNAYFAPPATNNPPIAHPPPQPNANNVNNTTPPPPKPPSNNVIKHFSHPHALKPMEIEKKNAKVCSACECELSGSAYCCTEAHCGFNLHKACFDSPRELRHKSHLEHPLTLLAASPYSDGFTCNACVKDGKGFVYTCGTCSYDLHIDCVQWPDKVTRPDHSHALTLYYSSPAAELNQDVTFMCDVCKNPVHDLAWVYHCRECDFGMHLECVTSGIKTEDNGGGAGKSQEELLMETELKFAVLQLLLDAQGRKAAVKLI